MMPMSSSAPPIETRTFTCAACAAAASAFTSLSGAPRLQSFVPDVTVPNASKRWVIFAKSIFVAHIEKLPAQLGRYMTARGTGLGDRAARAASACPGATVARGARCAGVGSPGARARRAPAFAARARGTRSRSTRRSRRRTLLVCQPSRPAHSCPRRRTGQTLEPPPPPVAERAASTFRASGFAAPAAGEDEGAERENRATDGTESRSHVEAPSRRGEDARGPSLVASRAPHRSSCRRHSNKAKSTASAIAWRPATLGCRLSPELKAGRYVVGLVGSCVAVSWSTIPSQPLPAPRMKALIAARPVSFWADQ